MSGRKAKDARRKAHPATDHPAFRRTHDVTNAADHMYLPCDGFTVSEWHPLPNGEGKPTMVCIIIKPADELGLPDCRFVLRMKSKEACQAMIDVLADHRNNVWGDT
jgi:hypothetical protein